MQSTGFDVKIEYKRYLKKKFLIKHNIIGKYKIKKEIGEYFHNSKVSKMAFDKTN